MQEHAFTWFSLLPQPDHLEGGVLVALLVLGFGAVVGWRIRRTEAAIEPEDGVTARNLGEAFVEAMSGLAEGVIGPGSARYVPLLAAFFAYIIVANMVGLVPGLSPPTAEFNMTLGLGVVSFVAYNVYGVREHGLKYVRQFTGPILVLAPLMFCIEVFSHLFRPISLGIRLFANLFADHQVVEIFTQLTYPPIPVAFLFLGAFVGVVQAFVFTMLSAVYISLAVSHEH